MAAVLSRRGCLKAAPSERGNCPTRADLHLLTGGVWARKQRRPVPPPELCAMILIEIWTPADMSN